MIIWSLKRNILTQKSGGHISWCRMVYIGCKQFYIMLFIWKTKGAKGWRRFVSLWRVTVLVEKVRTVGAGAGLKGAGAGLKSANNLLLFYLLFDGCSI